MPQKVAAALKKRAALKDNQTIDQETL